MRWHHTAVWVGLVTVLGAQEPLPSFPALQWLESGRILFNRYGKGYELDAHRRPLVLPKPDHGVLEGRPSFLGTPTHLVQALIHTEEGRFATAMRKTTQGRWMDLLKAEGDGWERVGELACHPEVGSGGIYPLENGQFLVFQYQIPLPRFTEDGSQGWVASIYRRKSGTRTLEWVRHLEVATKLRMGSAVTHAFLSPVITGDHIVVCCREFGLYWVFSRKHGGCLKEGRLFSEITDEMIALNRKLNVVINFQPLKDGSVLLAARPRKGLEDYLKAASQAYQKEQDRLRDLLEKAPTSARTRDSAVPVSAGLDVIRDVVRDRQQNLSAFPLVAWYELDPAKGRVKEVAEPPGAWSFIPSSEALRAYFWLPDADGRIWYYSPDLAMRSDKPVVPMKAPGKS